MQCSAVQCSAVQLSVVKLNVVKLSVVIFSAMQCLIAHNAEHCSAATVTLLGLYSGRANCLAVSASLTPSRYLTL